MRLLTFVFIIFMSGCTLVEYYEPITHQKDMEISRGQSGANNVLKLRVSNDLHFNLIIFPGEKPTIRMIFNLKHGQQLKFIDECFLITEENKQLMEAKINKIESNEIKNGIGTHITYSYEDTLPGETYNIETPYGNHVKVGKNIIIDAHPDKNLPIVFNLSLPKFIFNSKEYSFSPIKYTFKSGRFYQMQPW